MGLRRLAGRSRLGPEPPGPCDERVYLPQAIESMGASGLKIGPEFANRRRCNPEILEVGPRTIVVHGLPKRALEPVAEGNAKAHLGTIDEPARHASIQKLAQ